MLDYLIPYRSIIIKPALARQRSLKRCITFCYSLVYSRAWLVLSRPCIELLVSACAWLYVTAFLLVTNNRYDGDVTRHVTMSPMLHNKDCPARPVVFAVT